MQYLSYKFRLYPTKDQEVLLNKHFGAVRFVYNWALEYNTKQYAKTKKHLGWMTIVGGGDFIKLKEDHPWLYEIGANSLINTVSHLDKAFQRFFRHQGRFPKFKSKCDNHQSFEVPKGLELDFKHGKIQIPKFIKQKSFDNRIKCVFCRKVAKGKIGTATISRNPSGQYFVSFLVRIDEKEILMVDKKKISIDNSLGIDFGLKHFITLSDKRIFDSPEFFKHALKKLKRKQRKLSKKKTISKDENDVKNNKNQGKNREKQRIKVAKLYQHVSNQREDFLHNLTTRLANESQILAICVEDLNLKGMSKHWGRKIHDLSYYRFTQMLNYKLLKRGKYFLKIGRFDASSQICCKCGHRKKMPLNIRTYICPECGNEMDRDVNAAINIRNFAIRDIIKNLSTVATTGMNACGEERKSNPIAGNGNLDCSSENQENLRVILPQSQSSSVAE